MKYLLCGLSILSLTACSVDVSDPQTAGDDFTALEQVNAETPPPDQLQGVWRSRGYGWIFDIDETGITQYQHAGEFCFEAPEISLQLTDTLALPYQYYRLGRSPDQAILQLLPEDTEIHIERMDDLPAHCLAETASDKSAVFEYFATLIGLHYAFFEERNIDWFARVRATRESLNGVQSDVELFALLSGMIDGFSDSHTKLIAVIDDELNRQQDGLGETLPAVRDQGIEMPWLIDIFTTLQQDILDAGSQHTANDRILWGTIDDGRVGYIQLLVMGGFSGTDIGAPEFREDEFAVFDDVMDAALTAMSGSEYVIVDLSNNRGGYDAISRRLASRFTDEVFAAYTTQVPGSGVPARARYIEPSEGVRYTGPVVLMTSDVTVSGGEIATLSLRQLENVTHVGGITRGSFSTVLSKPLPNGWVAELSNEVFAAPDGSAYEEVGIAPEHPFRVFPSDHLMGGHAAAIDWILQSYPFSAEPGE
ncbi:S41 family peptidase [Ponticaulis sp.]|uniref:S41 family peptidase n=1 Tax=Ponticaulis sp. TaxID=2020902 RepID=UPI000B72FC60|nr:S41 family peptidase [Ponticaulis sp.]MAI89092.1 hypothetical protein [Ponticaulis sp.]OUY01375.1 MAG: hypothetical protein CBB65_01240 [Hyphomonadaceae bacterium TMED5]|tara:strand:+ start:11313 stop:12746 length:1434 start_codon:yes stop_codon:yes gene_type:complete